MNLNALDLSYVCRLIFVELCYLTWLLIFFFSVLSFGSFSLQLLTRTSRFFSVSCVSCYLFISSCSCVLVWWDVTFRSCLSGICVTFWVEVVLVWACSHLAFPWALADSRPPVPLLIQLDLYKYLKKTPFHPPGVKGGASGIPNGIGSKVVP